MAVNDILKCIFFNDTYFILIRILLNFGYNWLHAITVSGIGLTMNRRQATAKPIMTQYSVIFINIYLVTIKADTGSNCNMHNLCPLVTNELLPPLKGPAISKTFPCHDVIMRNKRSSGFGKPLSTLSNRDANTIIYLQCPDMKYIWSLFSTCPRLQHPHSLR